MHVTGQTHVPMTFGGGWAATSIRRPADRALAILSEASALGRER